jgi:hypothetical protein
VKKTAAIALVLLATAAHAAVPLELTGPFADARAQSAKQGKPLLIEFYAEW